MVRFYFLIFFVFSGVSFVSFAEGFDDLINESQTLSVLGEASVQSSKSESRRVYGIQAGRTGEQQVLLSTDAEAFQYDLGGGAPSVGAHFSFLPAGGGRGFDWGVDSSVNYLTQRGRGLDSGVSTQLHVVTFEPSLFVEKSIRFGLLPKIGGGYGLASYFQRGYNDENLNSIKGFGFIYGALGLQLNQFSLFESDLDWLLHIEHRASFISSGPEGLSNWMRTSLGLSVSI